MNKKRVSIVGVIIVGIIIAGVFVMQKRQKISVEQKQGVVQQQVEQQTENNDNKNDLDQAIIDTSDWQTFENDDLGFRIKYPKNLTYANQNAFDPSFGATFLFYDKKFTDVSKDSNPLLAVIDKKSGYIELTVFGGKDHVDRSVSDIKDSLTYGLSGPGGAIAATQELTRWIPIETIDKKTTLYLYTTDNTSVKTKKFIGQSKGVVWAIKGKFFSLELNGDMQKNSDLYENIALTFSQK